MSIEDKSLLDLVTENTIMYGSHTVENRALADYRDGCKPVHRRILWAMYKEGMHYNVGFKKAARIVGSVIGKFHPHGDAPVFQAMVTMANLSEPLINGQGNWGSPERGAAAPRYVECKLTKYSDLLLLDSDYLAVVPMVKNYDGELEEPVYLPARLPNLLVNGSEGIAMAVSCLIPSFTLDSVLQLTKMALKKPVTNKVCKNTLVFNFNYGGVCVSTDEELSSFFDIGSGTLKFQPELSLDKNIITIKRLSPRLNISKMIVNISELNNIKEFQDNREGDLIEFRAILKPSIIGKEKQDTFNEIKSLVTTSLPCQTAITIRRDDGDGALFRRSTVAEIMNNWIKWRISIEKKVLNRLLSIEKEKLEKHELMVLAIDKGDMLRQAQQKEEPSVFLSKVLKIESNKADYILNLTFLATAKREKPKHVQKIKEIKTKIKELLYFINHPEERIKETLKQV